MSYTITESCTGCTACTRKCPVNAIRGERKQLHAIDPLICIDCGACGKICPSQAVLDKAGRLVEAVKLAQWPKPVWDYPNCVECRICVMVCPTSSINLIRYQDQRNGLKPTYPFLQHVRTCIGCGFCEESCPTAAIRMEVLLPQPEAVMA